VHLDVAPFLSSPDLPERLISSYDVEKAEIKSSASSSVVMLRTTLNCTRAIPRSCREGQDSSRLSEI
jgi:hypothetical protein